jgi:hypothetical protein
MNTQSTLLSSDLIALISGGISTIVSSADAALRPSVMRAVGSTITPDGRTVTVYLARRQSLQILEDLSTTGRIAVVFSQPYSHRSLQLKGDHARSRPMEDSDLLLLTQYLHAMEREVSRVGFNPIFTQAMLGYTKEDVVAVSFEPTEAFDQTPGPRAGGSLAATPGDGAT